jgi:putative addiction module killer protein
MRLETSAHRFELQRACGRRKQEASVTGNRSKVKSSEMRMHYGPGDRLYFVRCGRVIVIMLNAGDKSSQKRDIRRALKLAAELGNDL